MKFWINSFTTETQSHREFSLFTTETRRHGDSSAILDRAVSYNDSNQAIQARSEYDSTVKGVAILTVGILLVSIGLPLSAWGADGSGFTITDPCSDGGNVLKNQHLHLTRFPKRKPGQEQRLTTSSFLGPTGIRDWIDVPAQLCTAASNSCSDAQTARIQIVDYSARYYPLVRNWLAMPRVSGNFEVRLKDGTEIKGSFTATERRVKYPHEPICE